jgi:hypothetical protein
MKRAITILIVAFAFLASSSSDKGYWVIDAKSQLTIYGSTNINSFACKIDCYMGSDTLQYILKIILSIVGESDEDFSLSSPTTRVNFS